LVPSRASGYRISSSISIHLQDGPIQVCIIQFDGFYRIHYAEMIKLKSAERVDELRFMVDENAVRQLCIRAARQYQSSSSIPAQDKTDVESLLKRLREEQGVFKKISSGNDPTLCRILSSYLKSLKAIEKSMISDRLFEGFDGSNPLLVALNREIGLTLESKGQLCHDDVPKRLYSRIDW
jgi:hypothetical protein